MYDWYRDIVIELPLLSKFDTRYYDEGTDDERVVIDIYSMTICIGTTIIRGDRYYSIGSSGNGWAGDTYVDIERLLRLDEIVNIVYGILIPYRLGYMKEY